MAEALFEAQQAYSKGFVPVGAVLTHNHRIISRSHNLNKPLDHAELLCLQEAGKVLSPYELSQSFIYVTLEPCIMCMGAISLSGIKIVYFGAYSEKSILIPQTEIYGGIKEIACSSLLKDFFKSKR